MKSWLRKHSLIPPKRILAIGLMLVALLASNGCASGSSSNSSCPAELDFKGVRYVGTSDDVTRGQPIGNAHYTGCDDGYGEVSGAEPAFAIENVNPTEAIAIDIAGNTQIYIAKRAKAVSPNWPD